MNLFGRRIRGDTDFLEMGITYLELWDADLIILLC